MATVAPVITTLSREPEVIQAEWALTTADHTGDPVKFPQHRDVCWHANSAAWGGATVKPEGSNTSTTGHFGPLKNADGGSDISFTADAGSPANSTASCLFKRPRLTVVGSGAAVNVVAIFAKNPRQ